MSRPYQLAWTSRGLAALRRLVGVVLVILASTLELSVEATAFDLPAGAVHVMPAAAFQPAQSAAHPQACHTMAACAVGLVPVASTLLSFVSGFRTLERARSWLAYPSLLCVPDLPPPRA